MSPTPLPASVDAVVALLDTHDYFADRRLATSVFLALTMRRPLFLEGEAGVGKTEIAKVLATALGKRLVRLQCYEGLDVASAVYEWNYPRQMIEIRLAESAGQLDREALAHDIFTPRFLLKRPILEALAPEDGVPPVLLIDELDRADEPFEAYLLEVLADFQVTIPELGRDRRDGAANRRHHFEPHARDPRRDQAPLSLPVARLPRRGARARDRAPQMPGRAGSAGARDRRLHAARARAGPLQGAGNRRDAGLGGGIDRCSTGSRSTRRPLPTPPACC